MLLWPFTPNRMCLHTRDYSDHPGERLSPSVIVSAHRCCWHIQVEPVDMTVSCVRITHYFMNCSSCSRVSPGAKTLLSFKLNKTNYFAAWVELVGTRVWSDWTWQGLVFLGSRAQSVKYAQTVHLIHKARVSNTWHDMIFFFVDTALWWSMVDVKKISRSVIMGF